MFGYSKAATAMRNWIYGTCLFEEGWLHPQVFGDHVQAEEVSVDSRSRHCHSIKILVPLWGQPEETPALFLCLSDQITFKMTPKRVKLHTTMSNFRIVYYEYCDLKRVSGDQWWGDDGIQTFNITSPFSRALTNAELSLEQDRTVSVRPSLNRRVIDASYVRQKPPRSWSTKMKRWRQENRRVRWETILQTVWEKLGWRNRQDREKVEEKGRLGLKTLPNTVRAYKISSWILLAVYKPAIPINASTEIQLTSLGTHTSLLSYQIQSALSTFQLDPRGFPQ